MELVDTNPTATKPTPIPNWVSDLTSPPAPAAKTGNIPDPIGFSSSHSSKKASQKDSSKAIPPRKPQTPEEVNTLKLKKAWEVAIMPLKTLPMTLVMMYMSGNTLQIFSIMMVVMAFKTPIMGLLGTVQAFERFETESNRSQMLPVKLAYVGVQLLALAVGVWKLNSMGLLPTTRSDWLAWETAREPLERAIPAL